MRKTCSMPSRLRVFVYLLAALPLALVDGGLLLAGWIAIPLVAITPLVVPALVLYRLATGWLAWVEARLAGALLGADAEPLLTSPGQGFWGSAAGVASDGAFWRQQVLLLWGAVLRSTIAVAELSLVVAGVWSLVIPLTYGTSDPQI